MPEVSKPKTVAVGSRDLLVHLHEWLNWHRTLHTRSFGYSDPSGHPHGYTGVVIPDWDLLQRIDDIEASLGLPSAHETTDSVVEELAKMLRDSSAMLNAAIRIVRPLDLNVKDVELWAEQVKVNMQALSNLDEARKTASSGTETGA